ncbi:hypothetical protein AB3H33_17690 [Escherichia coli]|uniref:hypothetical protein n=1 Tax=Escherichia coli TaxID=562 RepID=UPI003466CB2D
MSRKNAVKIKVNDSESSGYFFKASSKDDSFVISSKHGLCSRQSDCEEFLDNVQNCCRLCTQDLNIDNISFEIEGNKKLKPISYFSLENKDIVITKVDGVSNYPLRIGKIEKEKYYTYGYKSKCDKPGRILLNEPDLLDGICYFNICSDATPELIEKSEEYYGISGSLVFDSPEKDVLTAHAVITTNETNNDLGSEILHDIDFKEINNFFGCEVFLGKKLQFQLDDTFSKNFSKIGEVLVSDKLQIEIFISSYKGIPYFNLTPIADALIQSKFYYVFGNVSRSDHINIIAASNIILNKSHLEPANKLLTSKLTESILSAPHIYSTSIDDNNYHHIHFKQMTSGDIELIISCYGGGDDLLKDINGTLTELLHNINTYNLNKNSIIERSFLNQKFTDAQCEILYEIFLSD